MPPDAVIAALRRLWTILSARNVPAALAGGMALMAWNRARFTKDVDVLIAIDESSLKNLLYELYQAGMRVKGSQRLISVSENRFVQLVYEEPGSLLEIQVDLLLATTDFHNAALERRVPLVESALGFDAKVLRCEDLIVLKLLAWRILDRVDAAELLKLNREALDFSYLNTWIRRLHLQRQFREAWSDSFPSERSPI